MQTRQEAIDAHFISASAEDQQSPNRMRELEAEAARTGKMLMHEPRKSHHEEVIATALKGLPTIPKGDNRAFLDNIDKIAAAKLLVR